MRNGPKACTGYLIFALSWLALTFSAVAQQVPTLGPPTGIACAYNSPLLTIASGQAGWVQCDTNGKLLLGGTVSIAGSTSNASSGVATSSTNLPTIAYMYGFNGTTWDQVSSLTVGSKHAPTVAIVDASGNQITTFGGAASQASLGNVGGIFKQVCFNPTVTNGTYGANVVEGGLFTATNLFTSTGSGIIQSVSLDFTTAQTVSHKLYYFHSNPSNTTWTDHSAANINATDMLVVDGFVPLGNPDSGLAAASTVYSATGLGINYGTGGTSGYFVLVPTATTASLGATTNAFNLCVSVLQNS